MIRALSKSGVTSTDITSMTIYSKIPTFTDGSNILISNKINVGDKFILKDKKTGEIYNLIFGGALFMSFDYTENEQPKKFRDITIFMDICNNEWKMTPNGESVVGEKMQLLVSELYDKFYIAAISRCKFNVSGNELIQILKDMNKTDQSFEVTKYCEYQPEFAEIGKVEFGCETQSPRQVIWWG